MNKATKKL